MANSGSGENRLDQTKKASTSRVPDFLMMTLATLHEIAPKITSATPVSVTVPSEPKMMLASPSSAITMPVSWYFETDSWNTTAPNRMVKKALNSNNKHTKPPHNPN